MFVDACPLVTRHYSSLSVCFYEDLLAIRMDLFRKLVAIILIFSLKTWPL